MPFSESVVVLNLLFIRARYKSLLGLLFVSTLLLNAEFVAGQDKAGSANGLAYEFKRDIAYRDDDEKTREQCLLDVYFPKDKSDFSTVVWFHGGGLKSGKRKVPERLREKGIGVVSVTYRLTPKVQVVDCIDDAAASVAWTLKNIERFGGSSEKVFVSGHSAGGYLTSMIGLDKSYMAKHDADPDDLAGLIPFSGHTITHFTERKARGIDGKQPIIDKMAPLFHVRDDCPPILFITGDRELEMLGRYEENAYMWRMMKVVGHQDCELMELDGYNHGQMDDAAYPILIRFMKKYSQPKNNQASSDR